MNNDTSKPSVILADEPTGNLDSKTSRDVLGLLKVANQKYAQTIAMITHNEEIAQLADRIIRIEDGCIYPGGDKFPAKTDRRARTRKEDVTAAATPGVQDSQVGLD